MSKKISPIRVESSFLEGKGLTKGDPSEFDDYIERDDEGAEADQADGYSTHTFHSGKIEVGIYETGPGTCSSEPGGEGPRANPGRLRSDPRAL